MTVVDERTATDLEILESLDFEPEHECESRLHGTAEWHYGPAKYLLAVDYDCECGHSSHGTTIQLCGPAWDAAAQRGLKCGSGGCSRPHKRDDVWTIIAEFE